MNGMLKFNDFNKTRIRIDSIESYWIPNHLYGDLYIKTMNNNEPYKLSFESMMERDKIANKIDGIFKKLY